MNPTRRVGTNLLLLGNPFPIVHELNLEEIREGELDLGFLQEFFLL